MRKGHYGWSKDVDIFQAHPIYLNNTPEATFRHGVLNIGDGVFDGVNSGRYVGSMSGTYLAINAASGFQGDFIDLQLAGIAYIKLDASGNVVNYVGTYLGLRNPFEDSTYGLVNIGSQFFTGAGQFAGSASGTYLAINSLGSFTGNYIDCQLNGVSKFSVSAAGLITAGGVGIPDDLLALDWMQVS